MWSDNHPFVPCLGALCWFRGRRSPAYQFATHVKVYTKGTLSHVKQMKERATVDVFLFFFCSCMFCCIFFFFLIDKWEGSKIKLWREMEKEGLRKFKTYSLLPIILNKFQSSIGFPVSWHIVADYNWAVKLTLVNMVLVYSEASAW